MSDREALRGVHAPSGLAAARRALIEWVRDGGENGRVFLQVHLRIDGDDRYSIRHVDDRRRAASELEQITDPFNARHIAQTTADGAHRPLKTAPNLRGGWRFEALDARGLWTALDYLYPACVGHWHAAQEGTLRVTQWSDTASRQSGMYSSVRLLGEPALRDAVRACCNDAVCARQVAWGLNSDNQTPLASELPEDEQESLASDAARVPCPEACSMFVSFARAVLAVERSPRSEVAGLGVLSDLEVEQIRALVSAAAEGAAASPREGEFELPLNQRRLRYLAIRLARSDPGAQGNGGEGAASPG